MGFAVLFISAGDFWDEIQGGLEAGICLLETHVQQSYLARLQVELHSGIDINDGGYRDEAIGGTCLHESRRFVRMLALHDAAGASCQAIDTVDQCRVHGIQVGESGASLDIER